MLAHSEELQRSWIQDGLPAFTDRTLTTTAQLTQHLEIVRKDGYAVSNSDYLPGVAAVAAPILGRDGSVVASIRDTSVIGCVVALDSHRAA
nr:IclR family transcriptional regulator C-terminal domain-containing protein [Rhodococcus pyridinivorans]